MHRISFPPAKRTFLAWALVGTRLKMLWALGHVVVRHSIPSLTQADCFASKARALQATWGPTRLADPAAWSSQGGASPAKDIDILWCLSVVRKLSGRSSRCTWVQARRVDVGGCGLQRERVTAAACSRALMSGRARGQLIGSQRPGKPERDLRRAASSDHEPESGDERQKVGDAVLLLVSTSGYAG